MNYHIRVCIFPCTRTMSDYCHQYIAYHQNTANLKCEKLCAKGTRPPHPWAYRSDNHSWHVSFRTLLEKLYTDILHGLSFCSSHETNSELAGVTIITISSKVPTWPPDLYKYVNIIKPKSTYWHFCGSFYLPHPVSLYYLNYMYFTTLLMTMASV